MSDVTTYLARLPPAQRKALDKLRAQIAKLAPKATELVSYGVPIFKLDGMSLVGVGAAKTHCSFYAMSPKVIASVSEELDALGLKYSPGNIQFPADAPLPAALVACIVNARIAENKAMLAARAAKKAAKKK